VTYADTLAADRRLLILRCLEAAAGYRASAPLIVSFLRCQGHEPSADLIATELAWLAEQGLIERTAWDRVILLELTARGLDVALGRAQVPGVRRPAPGE